MTKLDDRERILTETKNLKINRPENSRGFQVEDIFPTKRIFEDAGRSASPNAALMIRLRLRPNAVSCANMGKLKMDIITLPVTDGSTINSQHRRLNKDRCRR